MVVGRARLIELQYSMQRVLGGYSQSGRTATVGVERAPASAQVEGLCLPLPRPGRSVRLRLAKAATPRRARGDELFAQARHLLMRTASGGGEAIGMAPEGVGIALPQGGRHALTFRLGANSLLLRDEAGHAHGSAGRSARPEGREDGVKGSPG